MKQLLKVFLLLVVAQAATAEPLPVWEIEGTENRVLLMGSIHYLRASDYPLPEGFDTAYELADAIVMEIDMGSIDPLQVQATLASMGTGERTLRESLGNDIYEEASRKAESLGIPLMLFDSFEPWFAALSITQLRMMQLGFDPSWGIETRMTQRAATDGKNIDGLETLEEQLGFMADMDAKTQREFLMQSLDEAEAVEAEVSSIVSAWRAGDAGELEELMMNGFEAAPGLEDALLIKRNRNWVRPIEALADQEDNYLVVVGAMHLVGDNSVVAMLEDNGWTVTQLDDRDLR